MWLRLLRLPFFFWLITWGFLLFEVFFFLNVGKNLDQSSLAKVGSFASSFLIIIILIWYTGWIFFMQSTIILRICLSPGNYSNAVKLYFEINEWMNEWMNRGRRQLATFVRSHAGDRVTLHQHITLSQKLNGFQCRSIRSYQTLSTFYKSFLVANLFKTSKWCMKKAKKLEGCIGR